ncbi:MAG: hypothetical protein HYU84_01940 [Chloroflexi bacterium]|nr:hypothetical protein [Chloroflexota bacterium]MBI3169137.1 hypothetical protein [Chloroflexota bacterium]
MVLVSRNLKLYFAAVGLFALWVGVWGYFFPTHVDKAIPWLVPPLHARFIGAIYFSATAFTIGGMLARSYTDAKIAIVVTTIWTGLLFVISLFYLGEFDPMNKRVWFWFGAYILYPLIGIGFLWRYRNLLEPTDGTLLPGWVRSYFSFQGTVLIILALALLLLPDMMLNLWPWKITRLLAQIYSSPFLAYGIGSLMLGRQKAWQEVKVIVTAAFVFVFLALLASFIHIELFSFERIATWVWLASFATAFILLGWMTLTSIRDGVKK